MHTFTQSTHLGKLYVFSVSEWTSASSARSLNEEVEWERKRSCTTASRSKDRGIESVRERHARGCCYHFYSVRQALHAGLHGTTTIWERESAALVGLHPLIGFIRWIEEEQPWDEEEVSSCSYRTAASNRLGADRPNDREKAEVNVEEGKRWRLHAGQGMEYVVAGAWLILLGNGFAWIYSKSTFVKANIYWFVVLMNMKNDEMFYLMVISARGINVTKNTLKSNKPRYIYDLH